MSRSGPDCPFLAGYGNHSYVLFTLVSTIPYHSTPNYSNPNRLLYYLGPGCVNHYPAQFPVDVELLLVPVFGAYFTRREFKYIHSTFDFRRLILLSLSLIAGIRAYRIYRSHLHIALHPESIGSLADQSTFFAWTCLMASW